jgi:hypothetical protein
MPLWFLIFLTPGTFARIEARHGSGRCLVVRVLSHPDGGEYRCPERRGFVCGGPEHRFPCHVGDDLTPERALGSPSDGNESVNLLTKSGPRGSALDLAATFHPPLSAERVDRSCHVDCGAEADVCTGGSHLQFELAGLHDAPPLHASEA